MDIVDISKARALELASLYAGVRWGLLNEDDITITTLSGGYSGRLYIIEDTSKICHDNPTKKFLIRLYGGKLIEKDDAIKAGKCESSEGIVFFANGQLGLGPQLLSVFDGGRVEEFVPSHRLTEVDLADYKISLELARKLARFHALQLPVPKKKRDLLSICAAYQDEYDKEKLMKLADYAGIQTDELSYLDEDYHAEHVFLRTFESKVGGRLVLCHGDLNKNNILVRDEPDKFNEQVMLIDYELAAIDYRGIDLAGLLLGRMFEMQDTGAFDQVCEWPDDNYRRMIIVEYLNETKKLNYFDFDENGVDAIDHVMMEMEFFVMFGLQLFLGFMKKMPSNDYMFQVPPAMVKSMLNFIPVLRKMFVSRKNHFIEKYGNVL